MINHQGLNFTVLLLDFKPQLLNTTDDAGARLVSQFSG